MRRILLLALLAACGPRAPAPVVGPPLGQSTAPGPRYPIYESTDASVVESGALSRGAIVGALGPPATTSAPAGNAAPGVSNQQAQPAEPGAPPSPGEVTTGSASSAPTTQGQTPSGVAEPEPQPGVASPPPTNP